MSREVLLNAHDQKVYRIVQQLALTVPEMHLNAVARALDCGLHVTLADLVPLEERGLIKPGARVATIVLATGHTGERLPSSP